MKFGTKEIDHFLLAHYIIGIDSNILIALIETNTDYSASAKQLFRLIEKHNNQVWFSVVTIPEVMKNRLKQKTKPSLKNTKRFLSIARFILQK